MIWIMRRCGRQHLLHLVDQVIQFVAICITEQLIYRNIIGTLQQFAAGFWHVLILGGLGGQLIISLCLVCFLGRWDVFNSVRPFAKCRDGIVGLEGTENQRCIELWLFRCPSSNLRIWE